MPKNNAESDNSSVKIKQEGNLITAKLANNVPTGDLLDLFERANKFSQNGSKDIGFIMNFLDVKQIQGNIMMLIIGDQNLRRMNTLGKVTTVIIGGTITVRTSFQKFAANVHFVNTEEEAKALFTGQE